MLTTIKDFKNVIKVTDLKLYKWSLNFDKVQWEILSEKVTDFGMYDALNRQFKGDANFWLQNNTILKNIPMLPFLAVKFYKDFIVLKNGDVYNVKQDCFENSEAFLLDCLDVLCVCWRSLFSFLSELYQYYPMFNSEFTALESSFVNHWVGTLLVIDELIMLLYNINSKFTFKNPIAFLKTSVHHNVNFIMPEIPKGSIISKGRVINDKENLQLMIIERFLSKKEWKTFLYYWLNSQIEYKFRIKNSNLSESEAISLFLNEALNRLNLETLKFLVVNPILDLDEVRRDAIELRKVRGIGPLFTALKAAIKADTKN